MSQSVSKQTQTQLFLFLSVTTTPFQIWCTEFVPFGRSINWAETWTQVFAFLCELLHPIDSVFASLVLVSYAFDPDDGTIIIGLLKAWIKGLSLFLLTWVLCPIKAIYFKSYASPWKPENEETTLCSAYRGCLSLGQLPFIPWPHTFPCSLYPMPTSVFS